MSHVNKGQSLVELLVAIGIGALLFIGTATLVAPSLEINKVTTQAQVGAALGEQLMDNVRVWSEGDWHNILNVATGSANTYYLIASSSPFTATSGVESIQVSTTTFTRSFYVSDVYRDSNGNVTTTVSGNTYDPSTKQLTVAYNWTRGATTTFVAYLTRNRTAVTDQTDWSGGSGQNGPITAPNAEFASALDMNYFTPGTLFASSPITTWPNGYVYRRTIVASSSLVAPSGTSLSNFPMLVSGAYSYLAASSSGGNVQNGNGYDIIFTSDASGTMPLAYERESYNSSNGAVNFWVNVPTLSSSSHQIYMFYDSTSTVSDQSNATGTWNSGYVGVWHFGNGATLGLNDSTANANNATDVNGVAATTTAQIYGAADFSPNTNAALVANSAAAGIQAGNITFSAWVYFDAAYTTSNGSAIVVRNGDDLSSNDADLLFGSFGGGGVTGSLNMQMYSNTGYFYGAASVQNTWIADTWYYVVGTYSSSAGTSVYINGSLAGTDSGTGRGSATSTDFQIGNSVDGGPSAFPGVIDEFRTSDVARSGDWIATEYNNQLSPSTFYSVSAAVTNNGTSNTTGMISSASGQHWAWNDSLGWIDFYNGNSVGVGSAGLTGYASSSVGDISLDCATTRNGNICNGVAPGAYVYYRSITVTSNSSIAPGTETNFPMLVSSTVLSWEASSTGGGIQKLCTASNGGQEPCDLVFATSTANCGTANLNFETESYSSSTGALVDWVDVPSLSAGTVIYACYDNTSVTTDQSNPTSTWNSNYSSVWHMNEAGDTTRKDSVSGNDLLDVDSNVGTAPGLIGQNAASFTGSGSQIFIPDFPLGGSSSTPWTLSFWANCPVAQTEAVFSDATGGGPYNSLIAFTVSNSTAYVYMFDDAQNESYVGPLDVPTNTWEYFTMQFAGYGVTSYMYYDAIPYQMGFSTTYSGGFKFSQIGNTSSYSSPLDCELDEMEYSPDVLSSNWVTNEYNNQSSPNTFYTLGSETVNGTTRQYQVINDGSGNLSGWAWNDAIGWIGFCGGESTTNCPGTVNYETTIDASGNFQGWAWNDDVGWIDFNCDNTGICGRSDFEVATTWLPPSSSASSSGQLASTIFDTGDTSGAQFNSILWQGAQAVSSTVEFQFAVSNSSSGPWTFSGPDGTGNTYYAPSGPGDAVGLNDGNFNNYRYFRYMLFITSANGTSSQVNDVVVNWSP